MYDMIFFKIPFSPSFSLINWLSNEILVFEISSLFGSEFVVCYECKNGPNLPLINLEIEIYSTGFYSPPGTKNEAYI